MFQYIRQKTSRACRRSKGKKRGSSPTSHAPTQPGFLGRGQNASEKYPVPALSLGLQDKLQRTDSEQPRSERHSDKGARERSSKHSSSAINTEAPRRDLQSRTSMASPAASRPYYRPFNASILELDGIQPENEPGRRPRSAVVVPVMSGSSSSLPAPTVTMTTPAFRYLPTNPAIFGDFTEQSSPETARRTLSDGQRRQLPESSTNTTTSRRGYRPTSQSILAGFDEDLSSIQDTAHGPGRARSSPAHVHLRHLSTTSTNSTTPAQTSNPYVQLIEARQNAMTVNFLRSQENLEDGELPAYPRDENG